MNNRVVVLTGAGISAESGLRTFRDHGGLWNNHRIEDVASIQAWRKNPGLVLEFYNRRRSQLKEVQPNAAHLMLKTLEEKYEVDIITQNVDDLHERAGSTRILHIHGKLLEAKSELNDGLVLPWYDDILMGDSAPDGNQLRPNIVWFGESVPLLDRAIQITRKAEIFVIVGTSLQVYPAASLIDFVPKDAQCFYIDPNPHRDPSVQHHIEVIAEKASIAVPILVNQLLSA
jgi:NAD-dependent deacetylase